MSQIAIAVFLVGIAGLFYLNRSQGDRARQSWVLWIPALWTFLGASRSVTQWLFGGAMVDSPDQYLEGSPIDRWFLSGLVFFGVAILASRARRVVQFIRANPIILIFFLYCLFSVLWSDFPLTAFKRWTKALGNVTMVLIILTDENPAAAIKSFFARTSFFLIPLSVLFIKYLPALGRGYFRYTWTTFFTGVATEKNGLGSICLVFGLAALWRFLEVYYSADRQERKRLMLAHGSVLVMTLWLLQKANSATSLAVFLLGSVFLLVTMRKGRKRQGTVHALVGMVIAMLIFVLVFPETYGSLVSMLGRNTTLTGRTDIWNDLFRIHLNPWVGTGFESFWLGDRAKYFWMKYMFHPNQAHNGYIETYVNLGWIGVFLLGLQILIGYRNISTAYQRDVPAAPLKLALLVAAVAFNLTEASFKVMHPVWIAFLLAILAVPSTMKPPRRKWETAAEPRAEPTALEEWYQSRELIGRSASLDLTAVENSEKLNRG